MPGETLRINEIFFSIQGESTWAGLPCVFIRLTGCHLRCTYCDTEYSFKEGGPRTLDDIIAEVRRHPTKLVEVTGGEPLLQPRIHTLITQLCDLGYTVLIETSGACDISTCDARSIRIVDLKTPGSGEVERNLWSNIEHLRAMDEVKFVITSREDYEWSRDVVREHELERKVKCALFSPVFEQPPGSEISGAAGLSMRELAEWILEDGLTVRLQPQLHKFIWDPQTRGV